MQWAFKNIDEERTVKQKLHALKQTEAVSAYTAEFQRIAASTTWGDSAQLSQYYQGLKDSVKNELAQAD